MPGKWVRSRYTPEGRTIMRPAPPPAPPVLPAPVMPVAPPRVRHPIDPSGLTVVYHAASMGGYRLIVPWQMQQLSRAGLKRIRCSHCGPDAAAVRDAAYRFGVDLTLDYNDPDLHVFEWNAIRLVEDIARESDGAVLYLHTKGVTAPSNQFETRWRELMHTYTVDNWRENLARLSEFDLCCMAWQQHPVHPHASGNFWLARCDYLRGLRPFEEVLKDDNHSRFAAEIWVGKSKTPPAVWSAFPVNTNWTLFTRPDYPHLYARGG